MSATDGGESVEYSTTNVPNHRPVWRDGMWRCTCQRYSAEEMRMFDGHARRAEEREASR